MLNRDHQALTVDPSKLLIGIASIELNSVPMGSIKDTSLEVTSTVKERYAGYPAQRMESTLESVTGLVKVTAEEIGAAPVISLLQNLFNNLVTQQAVTYDVKMLAPMVNTSNLELTAKTQLLPELTINWQDDWANIGFTFECIGTNATSLIGRQVIGGVRQPSTTIDITKLSIGKPKVLVNGVTVGAIQSLQLKVSGQVKKTERGYPKCTNGLIYLDSRIDLDIVTEEKILLGSDVQVEIQQAVIDGGYLSFLFSHCNIAEDLSFKPQNDWSGYGQKIQPFKTDISQLITFTRN